MNKYSIKQSALPFIILVREHILTSSGYVTCVDIPRNQRVKTQCSVLHSDPEIDMWHSGLHERDVLEILGHPLWGHIREISQHVQEKKSQHEDLVVLVSLHSMVSLGLFSFTSFSSLWISTVDLSIFNLSVFKEPWFCFKALRSTMMPLCPHVFWPKSSVSRLWLLTRAEARYWQLKGVMEQPQSL